MYKVLIIEDDEEIAFIEKEYLELSEYSVKICSNGKDGLAAALNESYDLILLDIMLPGLNGYEICKQLRQEINTPILMVTARGDEIDNIKGLGCGADDYIIKPFSPSVLVAKVKAHIAQYERLRSAADGSESEISFGDVKIQTNTCTVLKNSQKVSLAKKEYELLLFLIKNKDHIFSREDLYEYIWGIDSYGDNATVCVHINRLREKLEDNPSKPRFIQTVRGTGYFFNSQ